MTYAEEKAGRLKNLLYGMNKVGSHEEVLQTITDAFEKAMQAQREACFAHYTAVFNEMINDPEKPPISHIHNICQIAILNAEVQP